MITSVKPSIAALTASEREYIRRELDQFFGTLSTVAEGFQLRIWRGGAHSVDCERPFRPIVITDSGDRERALTAG